MTRMPEPPERSEFRSEEDLAAFDDVVRTRARQFDARPEGFRVTGYYGALLNSPPYARAQINAAFALRSAGNREGTYSHADREWVDQVLSHHFDYYGVLGMHTRDAVAVGVRLDAIEALWEGREEELTDDERLLTRFIRQLASGTVDDETWNAMHERLGTRGLVEYCCFITHLVIVLRMHQALDVPTELTSREQVLQLIRDIRAGTVELPDPVDAVRVGR